MKTETPKYDDLLQRIADLEAELDRARNLQSMSLANYGTHVCAGSNSNMPNDELMPFAVESAHYQMLLQLVSDAIVLTDASDKRQYANAAYFNLHGFDASSNFDSNYSKYIHPEDVIEYQNQSKVPNKTVEYRFRHNLGYWLTLQKATYYIPNELGAFSISVIKNISEQKKIERTLKETNSFIEKIINTSPTITYIYDIDEHRNVFINDGLSRLLGYASNELDETNADVLLQLLHPDDVQRAIIYRKQCAHALSDTVFETEYLLRHKNGEWRWLHCWESVFTRKSNGQTKQVSGIMLDVTSQKRTEQALTQNERSLKRQNEELQEAKQRAENADRLKSAFLANMSHEIRTPMNGIVGFAQLLAKEDISYDKRRYYTDIIGKSGQQLLNIISDIMDISKIETGQVKIQQETTNINALCCDLHALYRPVMLEKKLQLRFVNGLSDDECVVLIDKTKLTQIVTNLLNNALKFTSQGGIEVGYRLIDGVLQFWVRDSGVGIPAETLHSVFDRFYQVESNIRHHSGGTGLGLSICKAFVELMNGEMWVESEVGKGSCFWFSLPWIPLEIPQQKSLPQTENALLESATILVAEDEDINYEYIEEMYVDSPVKLIRATTGKASLSLLQAHPEISLVLMDIRMPVMNGYDATIEMRKTHPTLPIVAVTAYALSEDRQRFLPAGFNDYIAKPYVKDQIDEVILKYTRKRQTA